MIPDERLDELIGIYGQSTIGIEAVSIVKELKELRKKEDGYASLLSNANDNVERFEEYADKLRKENEDLRKEAADIFRELESWKKGSVKQDREIVSLNHQNKALIEDAERLWKNLNGIRRFREANPYKDTRWAVIDAGVLDQHKVLKASIEKEVSGT